jgi:hypothetical protein
VSNHPPLPVLTESRQKCGRRCQREHYFAYLLGYRVAVEDEALRLGTMEHKGLEVRWSGGDLDAALAAMEPLAASPFEFAKAYAMLVGYVARWEDDLERYEVLAVERTFEAPLLNPETGAASRTWVLGGKLDAVVRERATGRVLLLEHKTAGVDVSPGSDYFKRLVIDGQISTYYAGARALGYDVEGAIYDVLRKPALRPGVVPLLDEAGVKIVLDQGGARVKTKDGKKWRETGDSASGYVLQTRPETADEFRARCLDAIASDPTGYYARAEVVRLEAEMTEAAFDTWQLARQLRESEVAGRFPRNPDACVRYGSTCGFFPVCTGEASIEDETRYRKLTTINPELADVASAA